MITVEDSPLNGDSGTKAPSICDCHLHMVPRSLCMFARTGSQKGKEIKGGEGFLGARAETWFMFIFHISLATPNFIECWKYNLSVGLGRRGTGVEQFASPCHTSLVTSVILPLFLSPMHSSDEVCVGLSPSAVPGWALTSSLPQLLVHY